MNDAAFAAMQRLLKSKAYASGDMVFVKTPDGSDRLILDVRGWSYLCAELKDQASALDVQEGIARRVAAALNVTAGLRLREIEELFRDLRVLDEACKTGENVANALRTALETFRNLPEL